jgi:hypothetical protein
VTLDIPGDTVTIGVEIAGAAKAAVTAAFAFIVTVHTAAFTVVQPDHTEKELIPIVGGAVSVTDVPEL